MSGVTLEPQEDPAPEHDLSLAYLWGPVGPWTDVSEGARTKTGRCSRCHGWVTIDTDSVEVTASPKGGAKSDSTILCKCWGGHQGHPDRLNGCGAFWFDSEVMG